MAHAIYATQHQGVSPNLGNVTTSSLVLSADCGSLSPVSGSSQTQDNVGTTYTCSWSTVTQQLLHSSTHCDTTGTSSVVDCSQCKGSQSLQAFGTSSGRRQFRLVGCSLTPSWGAYSPLADVASHA